MALNSTNITPVITETSPNYGLVQMIYVRMGLSIVAIGYVTNCLSIAVFLRSKALRRSSTGTYLVSLAVADVLFLVGENVRLVNTGRRFLTSSNTLCQFIFSLRYGSKLTSAWITVVITAQRLFVIAFPLRAVSTCNRPSAYIGIALTYIVSFVCGCFPILCISVVKDSSRWGFKCDSDNDDLYNIFSWIFLRIGSLVLPGVFVLGLTIAICVMLARASSLRRRRLSAGRCDSVEMRNRSNTVDKNLTTMLLAVAIAFILLRLPYTIAFYVNFYKSKELSTWDSFAIFVAMKATDVLATTNYSVNFFLYCLSGNTFRVEFLKMFKCHQKPTNRSSIMLTKSTSMDKSQYKSQCSHLSSVSTSTTKT